MYKPKCVREEDYHKQLIYYIRKAHDVSLNLSVKPVSEESEESRFYQIVTDDLEDVLDYLSQTQHEL